MIFSLKFAHRLRRWGVRTRGRCARCCKGCDFRCRCRCRRHQRQRCQHRACTARRICVADAQLVTDETLSFGFFQRDLGAGVGSALEFGAPRSGERCDACRLRRVSSRSRGRDSPRATP